MTKRSLCGLCISRGMTGKVRSSDQITMTITTTGVTLIHEKKDKEKEEKEEK